MALKSEPTNIEIWDRRRHEVVHERLFNESTFRFLYENKWGYRLNQSLLIWPAFNRLYGFLQDLPSSRNKIPRFIDDFQIDMSEYQQKTYFSFNDFFVRRFADGVRPFVQNPNFPAVAEGRCLAFAAHENAVDLEIKGVRMDVSGLIPLHLQDNFAQGPCLIFRLSPMDYHHFHAPDDGRCLSQQDQKGFLDSVNPLSLKRRPDVFLRNKRRILHLQTASFSEILLIAIGGFCVGRIVQEPDQQNFRRGNNLGHFEFGGSTLVVFGKAGAWQPDAEVLRQTRRGMETLIRLGESVGVRSK